MSEPQNFLEELQKSLPEIPTSLNVKKQSDTEKTVSDMVKKEETKKAKRTKEVKEVKEVKEKEVNLIPKIQVSMTLGLSDEEMAEAIKNGLLTEKGKEHIEDNNLYRNFKKVKKELKEEEPEEPEVEPEEPEVEPEELKEEEEPIVESKVKKEETIFSALISRLALKEGVWKSAGKLKKIASGFLAFKKGEKKISEFYVDEKKEFQFRKETELQKDGYRVSPCDFFKIDIFSFPCILKVSDTQIKKGERTEIEISLKNGYVTLRRKE